MGDNIWTAFKDGISIYPEYFKVRLIVLQLQNSPWCSSVMLENLHAVLREIRSNNPQSTIILSGTSMGGSIVINSLKKSEITAHIHAVITSSSSTQLDKLLLATNSKKVKKALIMSTGDSVAPEKILKSQSLHYATPHIKLPIVIIYSPYDIILPSEHILETASKLIEQGTPVKLIKMNRPKGHYRPTKKELLNGFEWIREIIHL
ncbi:MAG: serine aminopeptidase domain-containing protein [Candidatus Scalindua sp.]